MPRKTIYHADIDFLQILDEQGRLDEALAKDTLCPEQVREMYQTMLLCREMDDIAQKLQRSGRMGTYPPNRGQEACAVGAAATLKRGVDYLVPYYRENSAMAWHGLPMHLMYLFWLGDERGNLIPKELGMNPMCIEIGAQILHAVGIAWAFKIRKEERTVLCFLGDGATSTGDFHEAMNFASVMKVPAVFCCVNNGWAISVPSRKQTASETFAQKALAYGMPTIRVDGNDVFAVYKAHKEAVDRARNGEGPSFVEAVTYRMGDHTTADDGRRYRPAEELTEWSGRDPLMRIRKYLEAKGLWSADEQARVEKESKEKVQEMTRQALQTPAAPVTDIFDSVFAELPDQLKVQRDTMRTDSIGQNPQQIGLKRAT